MNLNDDIHSAVNYVIGEGQKIVLFPHSVKVA